jgi:hypothetical protein
MFKKLGFENSLILGFNHFIVSDQMYIYIIGTNIYII